MATITPLIRNGRAVYAGAYAAVLDNEFDTAILLCFNPNIIWIKHTNLSYIVIGQLTEIRQECAASAAGWSKATGSGTGKTSILIIRQSLLYLHKVLIQLSLGATTGRLLWRPSRKD